MFKPVVSIILASSAAYAAEDVTEMPVNTTFAYDALSVLSDDKRFSRKLSGGLTIAAGGGLFLIGAVIPDTTVECGYRTCIEYDNSGAKSFMYLFGGVTAAVGVATLLIPTRAERDFIYVDRIKDVNQRESVAFTRLGNLAQSAKISRYGSGAVYAAASVYYLTMTQDADLGDFALYNGLVLGAVSAFSFLVESPEEKAFKSVESRNRNNFSHQMLIDPLNASAQIRLSYSY